MRRMLISGWLHGGESGFTIVELLVVISISTFLAAILFGPLDDLYTSNTRSTKSVIKVADTRGALRSMGQLLSLSTGFDDALTDHTGTNWNWIGTTSGGSTYRVLMSSAYATDPDVSADPTGTRTLLYACGLSTPLVNYTIYFVSNGTLYRRLMKSPTAPCSGTIGQHQTCATVGGASCPSVDATILTGVTNFTVDYYADSQNSTPLNDLGTGHTAYTDNSVPSNAKTIVVSLTARSGPGTSDTTTTSSLRITRVNGT